MACINKYACTIYGYKIRYTIINIGPIPKKIIRGTPLYNLLKKYYGGFIFIG